MLKIEYKRRIDSREADRAEGYARVLTEKLQAEYPGAQVAVTAAPSLCSPETIKVESVNGSVIDANALTTRISKIAWKTWERGEY